MRRSNSLKNIVKNNSRNNSKKSNKKITNTKRKKNTQKNNNIRKYRFRGGANAADVARNEGLRIESSVINNADRDLVAQYFKGAALGNLLLRMHHFGQEHQNLIRQEQQNFIQQGYQRLLMNRQLENARVFFGEDEDQNPDFDKIKLQIFDANKRMFFRDLRNTINQHLGEELINLINVDIEDNKLDYSFNEWWREQGEDQRRTPSLVLRSA